MRLLRLISALAVVGTASSCYTPGARRYQTNYDSSGVAWSKKVGTGTINGSAVGVVGGQRYNCAGQLVSLVPQSAYADENMMAFFGGLERGHYVYGNVKGFTKSTDPLYSKDMRGVFCGQDGRFRFENIPDGTYYVTTNFEGSNSIIVLGVGNLTRRIGMGLMHRAVVTGGNTVDVVLSPEK